MDADYVSPSTSRLAVKRHGPSWEFLKSFEVAETACLSVPSWNEATALVAGFQRLEAIERKESPKLLKCWSDRLADLGGDPSEHEWKRFRPLRLKREEDWSDWLQHLIETSKSGAFARQLFDHPGKLSDWTSPEVTREESTEDAHRADLVIRWSKTKHSHVEVKLEDKHLGKTYDTSHQLHTKFLSAKWIDYIILPESSLDAWRETKTHHVMKFSIKPITWYEVAVALRRTLWFRAESITWLAWAYAYTGAIERRLLKIKPLKKQEHWAAGSEILRCKLLRDGQTSIGETNETR